MNNLHRELAPISDAAWAQIEQEVARTFRRNLAGRRVVDVELAESGRECSAIGTGHLKALKAPQEGVIARQRIVMPPAAFPCRCMPSTTPAALPTSWPTARRRCSL